MGIQVAGKMIFINTVCKDDSLRLINRRHKRVEEVQVVALMVEEPGKSAERWPSYQLSVIGGNHAGKHI